MSIKQIWDFKNEIEALKEKNGELKILDLGCGNGNTFYHFHHQFGITNYLGIESHSINKVASEGSHHHNYGDKIKTADKISDSDIQNNPKPYLTLYEYYEEIFDKILSKNSHNSIKLSEKTFVDIYSNKEHFKFNIKVEEHIPKLKNEKFDIIIMSKILHYTAIKNYKGLIKSAFELLNKNGILYIQNREVDDSNREVDDSKKKRKLNYEELKKMVIEYFKIIKSLEKDQLSYFLLRKN